MCDKSPPDVKPEIPVSVRWLARWPPSTEPLSQLPLALVATVAVPTAIALHVVALSRLRTATRPQQDRTEYPLPAGR